MLFSVLSSPDFSMEDLLSELPTWTDEDLVPTERVLDRQLNMEDFEESVRTQRTCSFYMT